MNVTRSLLEYIKTKQLKWYGHVQGMEEGRLPKNVMKWSPPWRRKRGRPKATWAEGTRGLLGGKGINGWRLEWQRQMEEGDRIIVKWAQEDVETSNNLLNKTMLLNFQLLMLEWPCIIDTIIQTANQMQQ